MGFFDTTYTVTIGDPEHTQRSVRPKKRASSSRAGSRESVHTAAAAESTSCSTSKPHSVGDFLHNFRSAVNQFSPNCNSGTDTQPKYTKSSAPDRTYEEQPPVSRRHSDKASFGELMDKAFSTPPEREIVAPRRTSFTAAAHTTLAMPVDNIADKGRIQLTQQPPGAPLCWFTGVEDAISLTDKGNIDLQKRVSKNMDVQFEGEKKIHISKAELEKTLRMLKESGTPGDSRVVAMELAVRDLKGQSAEDYPEEAFRLLTGREPKVYGSNVSTQEIAKVLNNIENSSGKYAAVASFSFNWHGLSTHHIYAIKKIKNDNVELIDPNDINAKIILTKDTFIGNLSRLYSMNMNQ